MRRLFIRCFQLLAIAFLLVQGISVFQLDHLRAHGGAMHEVIRRSLAPSQAPVILMGDSVSAQLARHRAPDPRELLDLTGNAAISLAGQLAMLTVHARHNDLRGRTVLVACHPDSFTWNLADYYTFGYFVRLFDRPPFRDTFSPMVRERIRHVPLYPLAYLPSVRVSSWSPSWRPRAPDPSPSFYPALSSVTIESLQRMRALATEAGFSLHVVPPPVADEVYARLDMTSLHDQVRALGLQDLFGDYFETIPVLPRHLFREDDPIHFRTEALPLVEWPYLDAGFVRGKFAPARGATP